MIRPHVLPGIGVGADLGDYLDDIPLPPVYAVHDETPQPTIGDLRAAVRRALAESGALERIEPGMRVAVCAGSRGIDQIVPTLREAIVAVRERGGEPFVLAAMGSHGGATAEGQHEILSGYGITDEAMDAPVVVGTETERVATVEGNVPVWVNARALAADATLVVNRIKAHTDIRGPIESGLAKMCAIGLGGPRGASVFHRSGPQMLAKLIPIVAKETIRAAHIIGGIALIENAAGTLGEMRGVHPDEIGGPVEMALLERAKALHPRLPIDQLDVLIVDELGKDISGSGLDSVVIGRMYIHTVPEFERPDISIITVLDVTDASHGNAVGIGFADCIPASLVEKIDWRAMYINAATSGLGGPQRAKMPMVFPTMRQTVQAAIFMCGRSDFENVRLARIRNTHDARELAVSAAVRGELVGRPHLCVADSPQPLAFAE
ncbi:MAG: nickel pincer cofactor-dependent isomerase, group 22 [Thermomicrobiales bacterium]